MYSLLNKLFGLIYILYFVLYLKSFKWYHNVCFSYKKDETRSPISLN